MRRRRRWIRPTQVPASPGRTTPTSDGVDHREVGRGRGCGSGRFGTITDERRSPGHGTSKKKSLPRPGHRLRRELRRCRTSARARPRYESARDFVQDTAHAGPERRQGQGRPRAEPTPATRRRPLIADAREKARPGSPTPGRRPPRCSSTPATGQSPVSPTPGEGRPVVAQGASLLPTRPRRPASSPTPRSPSSRVSRRRRREQAQEDRAARRGRRWRRPSWPRSSRAAARRQLAVVLHPDTRHRATDAGRACGRDLEDTAAPAPTRPWPTPPRRPTR